MLIPNNPNTAISTTAHLLYNIKYGLFTKQWIIRNFFALFKALHLHLFSKFL